MTPGEALKAALHDAALDPRSTQDEQRWLGNLTYHLTASTAARIAAEAAKKLNGERKPNPWQTMEGIPDRTRVEVREPDNSITPMIVGSIQWNTAVRYLGENMPVRIALEQEG